MARAASTSAAAVTQAEARWAVDQVAALYGGRADQAWGLARLAERRGDVIRIISARKATKQEAKHYVESIEN